MRHPWFETRQSCPACGSSNFREIYEAPYDKPPIKEYLIDFYSTQGGVEFEYLDGAVYVLCECDRCGLVFQRDIPNAALMERLYEHWIDPQQVFARHQETDDLRHYSNYAQEIMQIVSCFDKNPTQLSFFDFGMGWGKWALMAKAFGCESYGTELSQERIAYAKSNGLKVIGWDEIPHHHFDFINTEQVFEHIPDPLGTLRHLKAALKPKGLIKISVPDGNDIDRRLKIMDWKAPKGSAKSLNPVAPLEHINCFRRSTFSSMAEAAEMEEVLLPIRKQYQFTTGWSSARQIAAKLALPLYRNVLKRQNYVFLRNVSNS